MSAPVSLASLEIGQSAKVIELRGEEVLQQRLMEMGLLPGMDLSLTRIAPLGDPLEIHVLGYRLSLRKQEAAAVLVEPAAS